jgi:transcriptional regulator with XRE-family HTH domain
MRRKGRERSTASKAVIELREALGLSQGEFASKVLLLSEISVARYETSHPPRGEQLLRLKEIADRQASWLLQKVEDKRTDASEKDPRDLEKMLTYVRLAERFASLYIEDLVKLSPREFVTVRASANEPEHGYLVLRVDGIENVIAAQDFLSVIQGLKSKNKKKKAAALKALDAMEEARKAIDGDNPNVNRIVDYSRARLTSIEE